MKGIKKEAMICWNKLLNYCKKMKDIEEHS
jgi:hypothetical protein